ncbi:MAG: cbb3-type cytochrome oxidase assembly protein CcoS [Phycisphaerales bacterium JB063]
MSVLYLVIPIALVLAGAGLAAFLWAVRKGQFDDLDTPAVRMLFDDEEDPGLGERNPTQADRKPPDDATIP